MARRRNPRPQFKPTLDDCEKAIDFLEDADNYDWNDEHCLESLTVRVRDYPENSGHFFLYLTWFGVENPRSGSIPIPPGWRLDGNWFSGEKDKKHGNIPVWHVGLVFEEE